MLERDFQRRVIERLKDTFPGAIVLKNDPNYIQGIPDLIVLYRDRWCALEVKKSLGASHRPNQEWYVSKMAEMSYAAFIAPENEDEVFDDIQRTFAA